MRKIKFTIDKGYPWGEKIEVREFDDDMDDNEIQEEFENWIISNTIGQWEDISYENNCYHKSVEC